MAEKISVHSRRGFLGVAAGAGAAVATARVNGVLGMGTAEAHESVATMLHAAATAEMVAATYYYAGSTGATFHMSEQSLGHVRRSLDAELHHLEILQSLGGRSLQQRFYLPDRLLSDAGVFVHAGILIETALSSAYLWATQQFAALGQPALAATAAQLGASEAQHLTLLSHMAGLIPNNFTLPRLENSEEATSMLLPFLRGGDGFTSRAAFPTASEQQHALAGVRATRVQPVILVATAS